MRKEQVSHANRSRAWDIVVIMYVSHLVQMFLDYLYFLRPLSINFNVKHVFFVDVVKLIKRLEPNF